MSAVDISEKMEEYSRFVSDKLRPELESAERARNETRNEIKEYKDLADRLRKFKEEKTKGLEAMVDLGHETLYCNASAKLDKIYLHVGMGFHVEMTIPEAIDSIYQRLIFLENDVLKGKERRVQEITNHIMGASEILDELNHELQHSN